MFFLALREILLSCIFGPNFFAAKKPCVEDSVSGEENAASKKKSFWRVQREQQNVTSPSGQSLLENEFPKNVNRGFTATGHNLVVA